MTSSNHRNFFIINATSYYELGQELARLSKDQLARDYNDFIKYKIQTYKPYKIKIKQYFKFVEYYFPHITEEIQGYADGLKIPLLDMFALLLEDEFEYTDKCTTIVTNNGKLIGHNEDWDKDSANSICLLKKTVDNISVTEFFYFFTLGGNSISINSNNILQAINSLDHKDHQIGIPKNIIARWLSFSSNLESDLNKLSQLTRSSGYHHTLINSQHIYSVESSATKLDYKKIDHSFVHTNHYLRRLINYEESKIDYSLERYKSATKHLKEYMSETELKTVLELKDQGDRKSIHNQRTIGSMIVNLQTNSLQVWMAREAHNGWIKYKL